MTCSDFVYKRRGVRKAFLKWLNVVDMESKVVLIVAVKSISAAEVDASAASIQDEIMSHHDEGDVRSIATDDRTIQLLPKFKQFTREEITSSCTTPRTDVSDESGKKFFLHRKIMAANQAMARQREENAGSAYIKHYLDDIHT